MTKNLTVRPGQAIHPVLFSDYYRRNWQACNFRWVFAFRKNLPLGGCNDTQAVEATFSSIKRDIRRKFSSCPTMQEFIASLPSVLDQRTKRRNKEMTLKRPKVHDEDPVHESAYDEAAGKLNLGGMKLFKHSLDMLKEKQCDMTLGVQY